MGAAVTVRLLHGDCRSVLKTLPDASVHCCVTSPPYWGLRSYLPAGHPDKPREIGSEPTVDEWVRVMVEVFREVRRVLRDDGTLWLNLGDSYAGGGMGGGSEHCKQRTNVGSLVERRPLGPGFKPKDLIGQPWRVAFALQQPYYAGKIKDDRDREWLAAMIDAEGCLFIHKRKAGAKSYSKYTRADGTEANYSRTADTFGVGLEIANTHKAIVDRIVALCGGTVTTQGPAQTGRRKQLIYRWRVGPNDTKRIVREVYPHLVGKQHQARLIFHCPSTGEAGVAAHQAMMDLHAGITPSVDYPAPPTMFEPGWYLRQELIWGKRNPMPESVRDRFTKSHEHVFLLSKSATYYFDFDAVQEDASEGTHARLAQNIEAQIGSFRAHAGEGRGGRPMKAMAGRQPAPTPKAALASSGNDGAYSDGKSERMGRGAGWRNNASFDDAMAVMPQTRNPRSVRWLASKPFRGAHFATYPPELIRPFVLAGCPPGGTVLDPFGGSGTTGLVCDQEGRSAILIDLDERNMPMARERITADAPLFAEVEA